MKSADEILNEFFQRRNGFPGAYLPSAIREEYLCLIQEARKEALETAAKIVHNCEDEDAYNKPLNLIIEEKINALMNQDDTK